MRRKVAQDIARELLRAIANLVRTYKEIDDRMQIRVDRAGLEQKKSIMEQIRKLEDVAEDIEDPEVYRNIKTEITNLDDALCAKEVQNYFIPESGIRKVKEDDKRP